MNSLFRNETSFKERIVNLAGVYYAAPFFLLLQYQLLENWDVDFVAEVLNHLSFFFLWW